MYVRWTLRGAGPATYPPDNMSQDNESLADTIKWPMGSCSSVSFR